MQDIRVDADGNQRCWNCGSKNFTQKRTFRAKATGVVAAVPTVGLVALTSLGTKKKLQCQACGEYNDVGSAKPWNGPANAKLGERRGTWRSNAAAANDLKAIKVGDFAKRQPKSYSVPVETLEGRMDSAIEVRGERVVWDDESLAVAFGKMSRMLGAPAAVVVPISDIAQAAWHKGQVRMLFRSGELLLLLADLRTQQRMEVLALALTAYIAEVEAAAVDIEDVPEPVALPAAPFSALHDDPITQIARLDELRKAGILTDEEFAAKKADLLGRL